jgi:Flp pilus assembly protein TadD
MVRQHQNAQGLVLLAAAARLDPANARYSYVYAIALDDAGQSNAAIATLERNVAAHPYDRDSLAALASYCAQAGKIEEALTYARRLDQLDPGDPQVRQMIQALSARIHP